MDYVLVICLIFVDIVFMISRHRSPSGLCGQPVSTIHTLVHIQTPVISMHIVTYPQIHRPYYYYYEIVQVHI